MKYLHGGNVFDKKINIDFSINVNPFGMPESVRNAAVKAIDMCSSYPDYDSRRLKEALSRFYGIDKEYFICGNGAAALIYDIIRTIMPRKGLVMAPTFVLYERALKTCGAQALTHELNENNGFAVDDSFVRAVYDNEPEVVFVCNPNNPTGRIVSRDILLSILEACKRVGAFLIIDECFIEFTYEKSFYSYLKDYDKLIIINAFTKIYAMAGLRSGYGICSCKEFIEKAENGRQSWNLSIPAEEASIAALNEKEYVALSRAYVKEQRKMLEKFIRELGIKVYESDADFILIYTEKEIYDELIGRGILIRDCSNYDGLSHGFYRIAVKGNEDNRCLIRALEEIMNG